MLYSWSQTDATNASADPNFTWAEGMTAALVNNSARAMMTALAKWRDDNSGALTTGGTSTAYTVTTNQVFDTLAHMDGQTLRLKMNATCGASPTLNVDGLGAKAIVTVAGVTAVAAGDLISGGVYSFVYNNSNGQWVVQISPSAFASGTLMLFQQTAAPTGWTKQTTHNDKALRVVSGTASSGGSTAFTTIMASRTITQGNLPSYTLPNTLGVSIDCAGQTPLGIPNGSSATAVGGTGNATFASSAFTTISAAFTGSVTSGGSGTAMDFAVQYVDLIIASKT